MNIIEGLNKYTFIAVFLETITMADPILKLNIKNLCEYKVNFQNITNFSFLPLACYVSLIRYQQFTRSPDVYS